MKKRARKTSAVAAGHHGGAGPAKGGAAAFSPGDADAFQVVDQIVALRESLVSMQSRPFSLATQAPSAARRLLDILENLNLRLAELESRA